MRTENLTLKANETQAFDIAPGRYVKISVTDTGVGMDAATRDKIFDPFFSTKDVGKGSGLGLASVFGIIKNHGGSIHVYSEKGSGTTFTIYLPASESETPKETSWQTPIETQYGQGTILLVDDEEIIIEVGQEMLKKLGYHVMVARGGEEALQLYEKHSDEIEIIILDMIMPGMGGGEAFDRLKTIDDNVRVVLSSGYSIDGQATKILDRGASGSSRSPSQLMMSPLSCVRHWMGMLESRTSNGKRCGETEVAVDSFISDLTFDSNR
ncbi:MAG: response regulator [Deltaproteobacteria bacterium]|nr:response regulator [Deltaproteobacteria bacterium]